MTRSNAAEKRYFQLHGLRSKTPEALNRSLREAISELRETLYGPSAEELTAPEQELLEASGVRIAEQRGGGDPLLDYATTFAALLETSLTPAEVVA